MLAPDYFHLGGLSFPQGKAALPCKMSQAPSCLTFPPDACCPGREIRSLYHEGVVWGCEQRGLRGIGMSVGRSWVSNSMLTPGLPRAPSLIMITVDKPATLSIEVNDSFKETDLTASLDSPLQDR